MTSQSSLAPTAVVGEESSGTTVFRRRWPLLAAVVFVALLATANLSIGASPPDVNATGDQVVAYYRAHGEAIRVSVWLTLLALLPFAALVGWLRGQVRGLGRDVFLLGAAAYMIQGTVWRWVLASLTLHPDQLDAHTARIFQDLAAYAGPALTVGVILLAAPLAWAALRRDNAAPAWFGWLSAVVVAEQAVETITLLGGSGFIAPGGPMNFPLGAGLFVVWVIACGAVFPANSAGRVPVVEDRAARQPAPV